MWVFYFAKNHACLQYSSLWLKYTFIGTPTCSLKPTQYPILSNIQWNNNISQKSWTTENVLHINTLFESLNVTKNKRMQTSLALF